MNDVIDGGNVESSSSDIGGEQDAVGSGFEADPTDTHVYERQVAFR